MVGKGKLLGLIGGIFVYLKGLVVWVLEIFTSLTKWFGLGVWREVGLWDLLKVLLATEVQDVILGVFWRLPKQEFDVFCVFCWCVWWERNKVVYGGLTCDPKTVFSFVESFLLEYHHALLVDRLQPSPIATALCRWLPPPLGCIKMNLDASVILGGNYLGIGVVYRDHYGLVLVACA